MTLFSKNLKELLGRKPQPVSEDIAYFQFSSQGCNKGQNTVLYGYTGEGTPIFALGLAAKQGLEGFSGVLPPSKSHPNGLPVSVVDMTLYKKKQKDPADVFCALAVDHDLPDEQQIQKIRTQSAPIMLPDKTLFKAARDQKKLVPAGDNAITKWVKQIMQSVDGQPIHPAALVYGNDVSMLDAFSDAIRNIDSTLHERLSKEPSTKNRKKYSY